MSGRYTGAGTRVDVARGVKVARGVLVAVGVALAVGLAVGVDVSVGVDVTVAVGTGQRPVTVNTELGATAPPGRLSESVKVVSPRVKTKVRTISGWTL
jgi:hypothetical protein